MDNVVDKVEAPTPEPITVPPLTAEAKSLIAQRVNAQLWGKTAPSLLDKMLAKLRRKADDANGYQW